MKRPDRITAIFGAVVLACVTLVGAFSASATSGGQTDPLITLSYLTQVVTPELLAKVDEQVAANEQALAERLDTAIADYSGQMEQALANGASGSAAAYQPVELTAGALLCPDVGCEIILRSGSAKIASGKVPVMINSTSGATLSIGSNLQENNLYVLPMDSAVVSAVTDCVILVRGTYTII